MLRLRFMSFMAINFIPFCEEGSRRTANIFPEHLDVFFGKYYSVNSIFCIKSERFSEDLKYICIFFKHFKIMDLKYFFKVFIKKKYFFQIFKIVKI